MKILVDRKFSNNREYGRGQEEQFEDSREDRLNTYLTVVWIGFFIGIALSLGSYYLLLNWLGMWVFKIVMM